MLAARKYFSFRIELALSAEIKIKTAIGTANALTPENIEIKDRNQQEKIDMASGAFALCMDFFEPPYNFEIFASVLNTY